MAKFDIIPICEVIWPYNNIININNIITIIIRSRTVIICEVIWPYNTAGAANWGSSRRSGSNSSLLPHTLFIAHGVIIVIINAILSHRYIHHHLHHYHSSLIAYNITISQR